MADETGLKRFKIIFLHFKTGVMSRNLGSPKQLGGRLFGLIGAGLAFYGLSNSIYNGKLLKLNSL